MRNGNNSERAGLAIRVRDVVVDHATPEGVLRALDCPRLDIAPSASLAISGPSGSGKSTLLALLAAIETPSEGEIRIGETRIDGMPEAQRTRFRRERIGVVYQKDNLLPFLTVSENIRLQLAVTGRTVGAAARVDALLARLGLEELGARLPDQLSGGQRQRAAIIRALVHEPGLILADEPTGALDEASAERVVVLLLEACANLGATLVVATHNPRVVGAMDSHLTLVGGRPEANKGAVNVP